MAQEKSPKFTVITNHDIDKKPKEADTGTTTPPNSGFHTNPMYEKLLKYKEEQKKKRFTVEDLLKW